MRRLSLEVVSVGTITVRFETACPIIDTFFGAITLLWSFSTSFLQTVASLAALLSALLRFAGRYSEGARFAA